MPLENICLVGANGRLGPAVLHALIDAKDFTVTVISRSSSKSKYPESVRVIHVSDNLPTEELTQVLKGQDALVVTFAGTNDDLQIRLADAAAQAGVKRFIPADFGSCDSGSPRALELMPLYRAKLKVREHLQELSSSTGLSWTSLICGHFFDYGLKTGLLSFNVKERRARIYDGGDIKWSASTLETVGTGVAKVLEKPDETRDRILYIQSFCVTQNEVLRSLKRVTGPEWQVEDMDSEEFIKKTKAETDRDPNDAEARESLVSVVGIVDANWESKRDFANSLLDLEGEDMDEVVRRVIGQL